MKSESKQERKGFLKEETKKRKREGERERRERKFNQK